MRRALTILELLAALALLSALALAAASLSATSARTAAHVPARGDWAAAAQRALALIHEDLVHGDAGAAGAGRERAAVTDGSLRITTRLRWAHSGDPSRAGPVRAEYRLDAERSLLTRGQRAPGAPDRPAGALIDLRPLLSGVARFECVIDTDAGTLSVRIVGLDGVERARRYALP